MCIVARLDPAHFPISHHPVLALAVHGQQLPGQEFSFNGNRRRFRFVCCLGGKRGEMSQIGRETVIWMLFVDKMESLIQNMETKSFGSSKKAGALVLVFVEGGGKLGFWVVYG